MYKKMISIIATGCSIWGFSDQKITYQSVTAGEKTTAEWNVKVVDSNLQITALSKGSDITMECSSDYFLKSYTEVVKQDRLLSITKEGAVLVVNSQDKGKQKLKSYKIGNTPWVQEFKFGLQTFLKASDKTYNFYILNPKDLALHEMIATKEAEEVLEIGDKKYTTQRLKITLTGFKKKFWKAYAWFDKADQVLVKYRANEGPGTPYTETTLIDNAL
jgi:hypothetical protein